MTPSSTLHALTAHRDRQRRVPVEVVIHQRLVVERRQHVAIQRDERALQTRHPGQRAGRAERFGFPVIREPNVVRQVGVREVDADELPKVTDTQVDVVNTRPVQRLDDVLENRPVADRHQRLRNHRRVRAQARAEPSSQI